MIGPDTRHKAQRPGVGGWITQVYAGGGVCLLHIIETRQVYIFVDLLPSVDLVVYRVAVEIGCHLCPLLDRIPVFHKHTDSDTLLVLLSVQTDEHHDRRFGAVLVGDGGGNQLSEVMASIVGTTNSNCSMASGCASG